MITFGPFACALTSGLVDAALAGDEKAAAILRKITLPPIIARQLRDAAICRLAALVRLWAPGISTRAVNVTIASALHERQACKTLNRLSEKERYEIASHAAKIRQLMRGKKTTLDHREIGRIVERWA